MEPVVAAALLIAVVGSFILGSLVGIQRSRRGSRVTIPVRLADALVVETPEAAPLDPWIELQRELKRSRRTSRPLALVRLTPPTGDDLPLIDVAAALAAVVRDVDRVWVEEREVFVLLPETDPREATLLAERLEREAAGVIAGLSMTSASFPSDALTAEDLLAQLRRSPSAVPVAVPALRVAGAPVARPRAVPNAGLASAAPSASDPARADMDRGETGSVAS